MLVFLKNVPRDRVGTELRHCIYDAQEGAYWGRDFVRTGERKPALSRYEIGEPRITKGEIGCTVAGAQERLAGQVGLYVIRVVVPSYEEAEQRLRTCRSLQATTANTP